MANCEALSTISKNCGANIGSIKQAWAIDLNLITGATYTAGTFTALSTSGDTVTEYEFRKNAAFYSVERAQQDTAGGYSYNHSLTLKFYKRELAKRNSIQALGAGNRDLVWIVKDGNGNYAVLGMSTSLDKSGGLHLGTETGGSGENRGAGSMYELTFTGTEEGEEIYIEQSVLTSLQ